MESIGAGVEVAVGRRQRREPMEIDPAAVFAPAPDELSPEEERLLIRDITVTAEADSKEGDTYYLIPQRWWQSWLDYVNQDMPNALNNGSQHKDSARRPPAIDNTDLINDMASEVSNMEIELHDTLVEGRDYILLPEQVWEKLHLWYGGGPTLPRKAINAGLSQTDLTIEVYPLRLQLLLSSKGEQAVIRISKKDTVGELHRKACDVFDLFVDQVCIWDYYGRQKHALMDSFDKTLDDANIQMDQDILVELLSDENGGMYGGCASSNQENGYIEKDVSMIAEGAKSSLSANENLLANSYASGSSTSELSKGQNARVDLAANLHGAPGYSTRGAPLGLTGLLNLGNTCFMNSAIQCLVHTPEFARYFREDYRREINWQNPLGTVGELALAFGELLRKLWAPGRTPVSPRPFKTKLSRFAPQFSGYSQHDSQELLAFLLDGLHEDLNRVKHKPYIKSKDADGRPDEEVADEYWENHIARNDSIIVDVCQGQYKSTLVCPVCEKVSVTFDPFMYLSLPLQSASSRSMTVVVFTSDGSSQPIPLTVNVPKQGRYKDLIQAISNACSLRSEEKIFLAEIRNHRIHHFLDDSTAMLSTIKDDDHIAAYKLPKIEKRVICIQFVHRREDQVVGNSNSSGWKHYGVPLIQQLARSETVTGANIYRMLDTMLAPMLCNDGSEHPYPLQSSMSETHQIDITNKKCEDSCESNGDGGELMPSYGSGSTLQLQLFDESNVPIEFTEEDIRVPSSSTSFTVFVNWSKNDLRKINTNYLESLPEVVKYAPALKRTRGEPLSLYACLDAFLREEPLVPEDMWYCPRCKEQRQASKKLDLWRLPEVLVIHLKRFSFSRSTKHKLESFVNFPIHNLDLTNYVANKNNPQHELYDLYAVTNHYGSMASGHYTAHIKLIDENRWYNFDDNHVSPISLEDVKSSAAYVLFYRRVRQPDVVAVSQSVQFSRKQNHNLSRI